MYFLKFGKWFLAVLSFISQFSKDVPKLLRPISRWPNVPFRFLRTVKCRKCHEQQNQKVPVPFVGVHRDIISVGDFHS